MKLHCLVVFPLIFIFACTYDTGNGNISDIDAAGEVGELAEKIENAVEETRESARAPRQSDDLGGEQQESGVAGGELREEAPPAEDKPQLNYSKRVDSGDLINLTGSDVLEIVDAHYIHRNDIFLSGNATLMIRDSLFEHAKDYTMQYGLHATGNSRVLVENSFVQTECTGSFNWMFDGNASMLADGMREGPDKCNLWRGFMGNSRGEIRNSVFSYGGFTVCDTAEVVIEDSENAEIELCWGSGAVVDEELPHYVLDAAFPNDNEANIGFSLVMRNTSVDGWGISVKPSGNVTIRNSPAVTVSLGVVPPWEGQRIVLDDLQSRRYIAKAWNVADSTLRFLNVTAYGWEPFVFSDNTLTVKNSRFTNVWSSSESTYVVENSEVVGIRAERNSETIVKNSKIKGDVIASGNARITVTDSEITSEEPQTIVARDSSVITLVSTPTTAEIQEEDDGRVVVE